MLEKKIYNSIDLQTNITYIKGVGPKRASVFKKNNIETVSDLLYHFPRRYLDRTTVKNIKNLRIGDAAVVVGKVESFGIKPTKKRRFFELIISDATGSLGCVWFNGISWVSDKFSIGDPIAVFGKVEFYNGKKITHPEFDLLDDDEPINTGKIIPLYPSTSDLKSVGLDSRGIRKIIITIFDSFDNEIQEFYSIKFLKEDGLISHHAALKEIHNPTNHDFLTKAIYRLKFDEHFFLQLLMALKKQYSEEKKGLVFDKKGPFVKSIYDSLSFTLTSSQINVLREIRTDLKSDKPMNRLIQGDVGSGKTIVAMLAASIIIGNGYQVAVMAPTEILTEQHYISFKEYCDKVNITCNLLIGNQSKKIKSEIYNKLFSGEIQLIVGTHSLIQQDVKFNKLGMIVIDEQHRFGVEHRKKLIDKGMHPEILAMTATPIPRTLAFTIHGDMDISIIDELPKNRIPVITKIVEPDRLKSVYKFMMKEMDKGKQCFIVFPLIEESEKMDLKAIETGFHKLENKIFKNYKLSYIHGKMNKEERDIKMLELAENKINCLVATTVIEVGINIPNATVMMIENAERFGLTQLHQLRGRIGRGSDQGYCILVQRNSGKDSTYRLKVMEQTSNGFKISDEDLKLRGPGEFFGTKQHGFMRSKLVDFIEDGPIIRHARNRAFQIVAVDPKLNRSDNSGIKKQFINNYKDMLEFVNIS